MEPKVETVIVTVTFSVSPQVGLCTLLNKSSESLSAMQSQPANHAGLQLRRACI
jgi:hypothetical protein